MSSECQALGNSFLIKTFSSRESATSRSAQHHHVSARIETVLTILADVMLRLWLYDAISGSHEPCQPSLSTGAGFAFGLLDTAAFLSTAAFRTLLCLLLHEAWEQVAQWVDSKGMGILKYTHTHRQTDRQTDRQGKKQDVSLVKLVCGQRRVCEPRHVRT